MWNPSAGKDSPSALPIHTVAARWGSKPGTIDPWGIKWPGYAPDWHVLTVRVDPTDRCYPFWVTGWMPKTGTDDCQSGEPFIWKVGDLSNARYDLTEAVYLPPEGEA
jgi:hypothetical protein